MATCTLVCSRLESQLKAGRILSSADERECLAQALQANIVYIVDSLLFTESSLPDQLINSGQITEDECRHVRKFKSRKDQVRYLISRTKGRDLKDIKKVIELIGTQIPNIVKKIYDKFEENKAKHVRCTSCALCQCFTAIDIKDVIDYIWSKRAISDGFYNEVILNSAPRGCQTELWKRLIETLNQMEAETRKEVYDSLFDAILSRGRFEFLVGPMQRILNQCNSVKCKCFSDREIEPLTPASTDSQPSSTSSCSERSSIASLSSASTCSDDASQENVHGEMVRPQQRDLRMLLLKPQDFTSVKTTTVSYFNQSNVNCNTGTQTEEKRSQTENDASINSHELIPDEIVMRKPKAEAIQIKADTVNIIARTLNRHGRNMDGISALKPDNIEDWIDIMKADTWLEKSKRTGKNLDSIAATSVRQFDEWLDILTSETISDNSKRHGRNLDDVAAADPKYVDDWIKVLTSGVISS